MELHLSVDQNRGVRMPEILLVKCKYCGSVVEMNKAVKINTETGEYEYACDNCAIQFNLKDDNSQETAVTANKELEPTAKE